MWNTEDSREKRECSQVWHRLCKITGYNEMHYCDHRICWLLTFLQSVMINFFLFFSVASLIWKSFRRTELNLVSGVKCNGSLYNFNWYLINLQKEGVTLFLFIHLFYIGTMVKPWWYPFEIPKESFRSIVLNQGTGDH